MVVFERLADCFFEGRIAGFPDVITDAQLLPIQIMATQAQPDLFALTLDGVNAPAHLMVAITKDNTIAWIEGNPGLQLYLLARDREHLPHINAAFFGIAGMHELLVIDAL